jgi:hypothetical protein
MVVPSRSQGLGGGVSAPSGNYYLAVQSALSCGRGNLQQTIVVPPSLIGSTLTIQFYLRKGSDVSGLSFDASTAVSVSKSGVVLQTIALTNSFTQYSISTPVLSSTTLISFEDASPVIGGLWSFLIDAVTSSLSGAVSTIILFIFYIFD